MYTCQSKLVWHLPVYTTIFTYYTSNSYSYPHLNYVTSVNSVYMLVYYTCKPHLTHGTVCPYMRLYMYYSYVVRFWASKRPGEHQRAIPALVASGYAQRAVC